MFILFVQFLIYLFFQNSHKIEGDWVIKGEEFMSIKISKKEICYFQPEPNGCFKYYIKNERITIKYDGFTQIFIFHIKNGNLLILKDLESNEETEFKRKK